MIKNVTFPEISTTRSSAQEHNDFTPLEDHVVTIPSGERTANVNIAIRDDEIRESDEYFIVRLSTDEDGDIGPLNEAKVFIVDDEGKVDYFLNT